MQMASRTNVAWGVAGNIGLRPHKKYPRLGRGIFIYVLYKSDKKKQNNLEHKTIYISSVKW